MRRRYFFIITLLLAGCTAQPTGRDVSSAPPSSSAVSSHEESSVDVDFLLPIARASERVTKKPFGIYVTPKDSPVQPERFTGYHTGEDFETFPEEQDTDVVISAICSGTVRFAGWVSGYGGVLIEQCVRDAMPVTVLYGHLNIDSVTMKAGSNLATGTTIGMLGTGDSHETDGERKHLHLSIHMGTALELRGYVQTKKELEGWVNPFSF